MMRRLASAAGYAMALAAYVPAALWVAWQTQDRINPDAIAYIQIARHYAAGRFDLAVNGWFGPALSWLLVPAIWLHGEPVLALRIYNVLFGVILAAGAALLTRTITGGRFGPWAFAAALALAVAAVGDEITPDLMLAAGLTWYFAISIRLVLTPTIKRGFAAGLLAGVCFMIKAYALPLAAAHLTMTFAWQWFVGRKTGDAPYLSKGMNRVCLYLPMAAVGGLLAAALPWIVVISLQAGHPCISTTGCSAASWGPLSTDGPLPVHRVQLPRDGRITGWENPIEIPHRWPTWRGTSVGEIEGRLKIAGINAGQIAGALYSMDTLSLLLIGLATAAVLAVAFRRTMRSPHAAMRTWALLSVAICLGGLLPLWVFDRLLWPVWGLAIAIFFSLMDSGALWLADRGGRPGMLKWLPATWGVLLLASISMHSARAIVETHLPASDHGRWLRRVAGELVPHQRVAANQWYDGLFCSYWADAVYLGQPLLLEPAGVRDEIAPLGPAVFIVFDDEDLAHRLIAANATQRAIAQTKGERAWLFSCRGEPCK